MAEDIFVKVGGTWKSLLASKLDLAGGKILQIVRATDSTERSTTSTSFVDASISVTITPQKSDSAILLMWIATASNSTANNQVIFRITDSSDNLISGGGDAFFIAGINYQSVGQIVVAYATPATTSAITYKVRFRVNGGTGFIVNATRTGQLYAIEVSA